MEITIKNNQRLIKVNRLRIEHTLKRVIRHLIHNYPGKYGFLKSVELSILLVNDSKMMELNLKYRRKDKTTDVLSFPQIVWSAVRKAIDTQHPIYDAQRSTLDAPRLTHLGDIVINLHQAKRQAKEHKLTFYGEVSWLLVHGLLHLLGYDHEINKYQARKMTEMERELLGALRVMK